MYIYLSSNQSDGYFTANDTATFRVKLPKTIHLSDNSEWCIAILDIDLPRFSDGYKTDYITINSPICEPSIVCNTLSPILDRVYFWYVSKGKPISFVTPRYVPLTVNVLDIIDVYLRDSAGNAPSFKTGHLTCTLHLTEKV